MADFNDIIVDQRYQMLELLGEGGMAMVYRANDSHLDRTVALKIIPKERFNKEQLEEILRRFEQEAKALTKLSHPNIVPILDCGEHEGSPYLVLEYLSGGTLRKWMETPIPWQAAVQIILPIMDALMYCHQQSILHRDIKPSNILFKEDDKPVLADFGIAKLLESAGTSPKTGTGVFVGTPGYMAPEQYNDNNHTKLDAFTDVYQLGIVLYEVISGYRPSDLANIDEPIPHPKEYAPNIPVDFDRILLKALAFNPKKRYQTMEEFKAAIQASLNQHPYPTDTQGTLHPRPSKTSEDKKTPRPSRPLRVFLCHAKPDGDYVTGLDAALRQEKIKVRLDKKNSDPEEHWQEKISKDVPKSDAVIVCLTHNSIEKNGILQPEIRLALEKAHEYSIFIIPVRLHPCKFPQELSTIKHVDLFEEGGYIKLRNLLAARAKKISAAPPITGAFYLPPMIKEKEVSTKKYISLIAFIFILIFAILLIFPSFRNQFLPGVPASAISPTSTVTATEPSTSPIPEPGVTVYKSEITDPKGITMLFVKEEVFTIGYEAKRALSECKKYSSNCSLNSFFISEPTGSVFLKPYYIDQYEVTNSAYQKCVDAKVCEPPQETRSSTITEYYGNPDFDAYPVIYVDWYMAKTYCEAWRGARLPTEAEWEKAARATSGSLFPWGNILEDKRANFCDKQCPFSFANRNWEDGYADTAPVDALPNGISAYGVFNMAGNVWEWTSSLYKPYPYDLSDNREYLQTTGIRVVRGGSWRDDIGGVFSIARNGYEPSKASDFLGFRCAKTR